MKLELGAGHSHLLAPEVEPAVAGCELDLHTWPAYESAGAGAGRAVRIQQAGACVGAVSVGDGPWRAPAGGCCRGDDEPDHEGQEQENLAKGHIPSFLPSKRDRVLGFSSPRRYYFRAGPPYILP